MNNISMSVVNMLYNFHLMKYEGRNGIVAYGVLIYVSMIFQAVYIEYAVVTAWFLKKQSRKYGDA
mgnify:CR=1 FL=1